MRHRSVLALIVLLSGRTDFMWCQASTERYETVTPQFEIAVRMQGFEMDTSPDSVFKILLTSSLWEYNFRQGTLEDEGFVGSMRIDCVATKVPSSPRVNFLLWTKTKPDHSDSSAVFLEGFRVVNQVGFRLDGELLQSDEAVWFPKPAPHIMYWYDLDKAMPLLNTLATGKSLRFFFGATDGGRHVIQWTVKTKALQAEILKLVDRCVGAFGR